MCFRILIASFVLLHWSALVSELLCAQPIPDQAKEMKRVDRGAAPEPATDARIYGQTIRETSWRSPEQERSGFHLPPGFEIRLFAAEPQINKPINMAFDSQGRLWVSHTVEYPYPASDETSGNDRVSILSDSDGDGQADRISTFADKLNIPMGVLPWGDGCFCFSIPYIWYLRDTDGDGVCDQRDRLLGPFDTSRDTHGMVNALRDGGDGWIYACHGFNNQSRVAGSDGHLVAMNSGNTFRFRPDGTRIELVTRGQVNPFGMTVDAWGYRYSADCHSKPITQLIFGACYPSFSRPHDGLGFLPPMMDDAHGSTAISGIVYVSRDSPIVPLRGQFISGNVMTSRLNRTALSYVGATAKGKALSDFLTSDDPWFRPVDLQLGPDNALYVADFYNKIIGHYEVPLDHPDRDRTSGRIWQIRYVGPPENDQEIVQPPSKSDEKQIGLLRRMIRDEDRDAELWQSALSDPSARLRVAALRLAREMQGDHAAELVPIARKMLTRDANPHVRVAAAEFLGRHGMSSDLRILRQSLDRVDQSDPVLRQSIRIAIRDRLLDADASDTLWEQSPDQVLANILLAVTRPEASGLLLRFLNTHPQAENRDELLMHAARHASAQTLSQCVAIARRMAAGNQDQAYELLDILAGAVGAGRGSVPDQLRVWALQLVTDDLQQAKAQPSIVAWVADDGSQWPGESRRLSDGRTIHVTSSFGRGESYTGTIKSDPFPAPPAIEFWIMGHNGFPNSPDHHKNAMQLRLADSDRIVFQTYPPRSDIGVPVHWDTRSIAGQSVYIECADRDSGNAYAWIAFGEFKPALIHNPAVVQSLTRGLEWIRRLGLMETESDLVALLGRSDLSTHVRLVIGRTVASLRSDSIGEIVMDFLTKIHPPADLVQASLNQLGHPAETDWDPVLQATCQRMSGDQQTDFALAWIQRGAPLATLVSMVESGWIHRMALADPNVVQSIQQQDDATLASRIESLTRNVDLSANQMERIGRIRERVGSDTGDAASGAKLFQQHCAACHQMRGKGALVGPQLDGVATRSVDRLLEDLLLPDRNVDKAFRTSTLLLVDGRLVVGLVADETETELTVIDPAGKPASIPRSLIERRRDDGRSLMPSNMGDLMSDDQIVDLIRFLKQPN